MNESTGAAAAEQQLGIFVIELSMPTNPAVGSVNGIRPILEALLAYGFRLVNVANVLQSPANPTFAHTNALIFASTCALSASSAAISSRISLGLRCAATSPPFGFFTDRSNVA